MTNLRKTWFETWGEERAQSSVLKGILIIFMMALGTTTTALVILAKRQPLLISLASDRSELVSASLPSSNQLKVETERT